MNEQLLDLNLKRLQLACKKNGNYKTLTIAFFTLIKNRIIEIGINLGVKPVGSDRSNTIYDYITLINSIFLKNLGVVIFPENMCESIQICEVIFLRNKGKLPDKNLKSIIDIYYELRKLEVPNLHRQVNEDDLSSVAQGNIFSLLTPRSKRNSQDSHKLKPLILQKIREKEKEFHQDLNSRIDPGKLESALYLKSLRKMLEHNKNSKIVIQGALKDNISYQKSLPGIFGYLIIGVIITLLSVGAIILFEMDSNPIIIPYIDSWVISLFVGIIVLFFLYVKFIKKGGS